MLDLCPTTSIKEGTMTKDPAFMSYNDWQQASRREHFKRLATKNLKGDIECH